MNSETINILAYVFNAFLTLGLIINPRIYLPKIALNSRIVFSIIILFGCIFFIIIDESRNAAIVSAMISIHWASLLRGISIGLNKTEEENDKNEES